jgi:hypothetical protein
VSRACRNPEVERRRFGEEVREVARQHIISDLRSEGWTDDYPFPKNERHYREMGLF